MKTILTFLAIFALSCLCGAVMSSCSSYSTAPVAAHAGAGYVVGSGSGAMMALPTAGSRHQAEAQKAQAFFGGGR